MRLILPMAGAGDRFFNDGYTLPKPLIDVGGKPMFMRVIENLGDTWDDITCIVNSDHVRDYNIGERIMAYDSNINIVVTDGLTEGAACTVMLAINKESETPLMIANCDQIMIWDKPGFDEARRGWNAVYEEFGGTIMTFTPDHDEPKHSYIQLSKYGSTMTSLQEKNYLFPDGYVSDLATTGVYYFNSEKDFHVAATEMIGLNDRTNGEFYLAPIYNYIDGWITHYPVDKMIGMGTPEELKATLHEHSDFNNWAV